MTIALTGATGFLGSHIALALRAAGLPVRGVVRNPAKGAWLAERGVDLVPADLTSSADLSAAFRGCDAVVANAALGSYLGELEDFLRTNVVGTENALHAAADAGVSRVVYVSSVAVYRTRVLQYLPETAERYGNVRRKSWSDLTTDWRYSLSKSLAEDRAWAIAEERGLQLTVLRPAPVYGSRDERWTARIRGMHARSWLMTPLVGVPMVHAGDVAAAALAALQRPETVGKAYNLAGPPVSPWRILGLLRALTGRGPWRIPLPLPLWVAYDTTAAERDLGFTNRALEEGLREAFGIEEREF